MMSLYEEYVLERMNAKVIRNNNGFIVYRIKGEHGFIEELYIRFPMRKLGIATDLADQVVNICKENGCKYLQCSTDDRANGVEFSKIAILSYGFVKAQEDGSITRYIMEI